MDIKDIFLDSDEYFQSDYKKTIVYLHHTAGSCFVGETLIDLVDGTQRRIDSLEIGKEYWIYGCDINGNVRLVKSIALGETKKVNEIIEITLDNGKKERCTCDHLWMMRNGEYKKAEELVINDSLMPLYKKIDKRGYEEIKNNLDNKWYKTHQLSGKLKYNENIYKNEKKMVLHHIDFDKLNNIPDNLLLMEKNDHIIYHSKLMKDNWKNEDWILKMKKVSSINMKNTMLKKLKNKDYILQLSNNLKRRWKNGEFDYQIGSTLSEETKNKIRESINKKYGNEEFLTKIKKLSSERLKKMWENEDYREHMSKALKEKWKDPEYRKKVFKFDVKFNKKLWNDEHRKKVSKAVSERNKLYAIYKKSDSFNNIPYKKWKETYNHKIINIKKIILEDYISVYDIHSPETNNFALSSGVFVHNSRPDWVVNGWNKDQSGDGSVRRIATSFVVGGKSTRDGDVTWDGTVVRCFPENQWAWHLGAKGTNGLFDKISIGIEICNYGYLSRSKTGQFMTYVNTPVPEDQVCELPTPFRGYKYYQKYTDAQLNSVRELLIHLSSKFNINIKLGLQEWINKENLLMPNGLSILQQQKWLNQFGFVGKNGRQLTEDGIWGENSAWAVQSVGKSAFEYNPLTLNGYPGLWSHGSIRRDKTDVSPQPNLISMIKSL